VLMEWPPTAATEREVNMGGNGMIGWLKKACLVRADIFIRIGKQRQQMVASRRGLVRYFGARRPCSIFLEVSALRFNHEDRIPGITETRRSGGAP